jgi:hypothetical protein
MAGEFDDRHGAAMMVVAEMWSVALVKMTCSCHDISQMTFFDMHTYCTYQASILFLEQCKVKCL